MGEPREGRGTPGHPALLTQSDHDIIRSFLSTVPAGFPLSPGGALAELTSGPWSPGLLPHNYHFAMSPHNRDPPSPSRYPRAPLGLHSPRTSACNSPRRFLGSPLRAPSRPTSPEPHRTSPTHIQLHPLHRETFGSPRPEAWSPPPYEGEAPPYPAHYFPPHPHHSPYRRSRAANTPSPPSSPLPSSPRHPHTRHSPGRASPRPRYHAPRPADYHYAFSPSHFSPGPFHAPYPPPDLPRLPLALEQGEHLDLEQGEPLDLEVTPCSQELPRRSPSPRQPSPLPPAPAKARPLTDLISARLARDGQRSRGRRRGPNRPAASRRRQPAKADPPPPSAAPPSSCQPEAEAGVAARLGQGCDCGLPCLALGAGLVHGHRAAVARLSKQEHDMYLMGLIMATLVSPDTTSKHKERQRSRNKYVFRGREVCLEAFLYLENVTVYHIKAIRAHLLQHGLVPRSQRKVAKREPSGLQQHCAAALAFLQGQEEASCRNLHQLYRERFREESSSLLMSYSVFRSWAARRLPGLAREGGGGISLPARAPADTQLTLDMNSIQ